MNSGRLLSIGVFFSLMIAGLALRLPRALTSGLEAQGIPHAVAAQVGALPPVSSLFAALLGDNPIRQLLAPSGALAGISAAQRAVLTGTTFFPHLLGTPFHDGVVVAFGVAAGLSLLAALFSGLRGKRYLHTATKEDSDGAHRARPDAGTDRDRPAEGDRRAADRTARR
jgi:hypothetical protein